MKADKLKLISIAITAVLVILGFIVYGLVGLKDGQINVAIGTGVVAVVILVLLIIFVKNNYHELKKGLPLGDERSNKVLMIAFAKAYLYSIWLLLILGWLSDSVIKFRDVSQALGAGILGMAVLFGLCWLWYNNKEDLDSIKI